MLESTITWIALGVEQLAYKGKIKDVYMFRVSYGCTRYFRVYMSAETYIPVSRKLRVYPVLRCIYVGCTRYLHDSRDGYCSTCRAIERPLLYKTSNKTGDCSTCRAINGHFWAVALGVEQSRRYCSRPRAIQVP
jgi:hypothetical protein